MENQLSQMYRKVHRLKVLGHNLKDSLIAAVMVMSLPDSYASLRQHLGRNGSLTIPHSGHPFQLV